MFPVETGKIFAEKLADIGGTSQRTIVFDRALPHERDAIDRYASGAALGTALRLSFLKQPELLLHETFASPF